MALRERERESEKGFRASSAAALDKLFVELLHSQSLKEESVRGCLLHSVQHSFPLAVPTLSPLTYDGLSLMQIYNHFICRCLPCPSRNIPQHHASRCPPQNTLHHRPPLNLSFHKSQQNKDKCPDFGCLNIMPQRNTFNMMLWACVTVMCCHIYTSGRFATFLCIWEHYKAAFKLCPPPHVFDTFIFEWALMVVANGFKIVLWKEKAIMLYMCKMHKAETLIFTWGIIFCCEE